MFCLICLSLWEDRDESNGHTDRSKKAIGKDSNLSPVIPEESFASKQLCLQLLQRCKMSDQIESRNYVYLSILWATICRCGLGGQVRKIVRKRLPKECTNQCEQVGLWLQNGHQLVTRTAFFSDTRNISFKLQPKCQSKVNCMKTEIKTKRLKVKKFSVAKDM